MSLSSVQLAPERASREQMHQYADTQDQNQIVDHAGVGDVHLFQELRGLFIMTIEVVAFQVHPIEPVHGVQKTVKAGAEVRYVEHPTEHQRRVHVTDAKSENREQHSQDGAREHGDLDRRGGSDEEAPSLSRQAGGYANDHERNNTRRFDRLSCQPVAYGQIGRCASCLKRDLHQQHADVIRR